MNEYTQSNRLINETSPYLLQHAYNPVNWFPWGNEAFETAKKEDKPIFLSIGYSTCHWCHVMAHESFEDKEIADILNRYFVSIKVDKEERPDIDSIYMAVCQAFTGSGGWPTSIFMTADQKPFFAGTYFPKTAKYGWAGLKELLTIIYDKWLNDREALINSANEIISSINYKQNISAQADEKLISQAIEIYKKSFDKKFGGFGPAPKFPTPHNLMFLMNEYVKHGDKDTLTMVKKTLMQMYSGGMFDHIGYGFSRYSTDRFYLVPHFEKMLYDNALLIISYSRAYQTTKRPVYMDVAEKTADYILREMVSSDGGFFSAQDADSDGEEGKYYIFTPDEIIKVLGESDGKEFNEHFGITKDGNFEGKNIPNLLESKKLSDKFDKFMPKLREYRKSRTDLHLDDKILTAWNSLMISAFCELFRITSKIQYLETAKKAVRFIEEKLCENDTLYVSYRDGKRSGKGFLDDYASFVFALISLYDATLDRKYLKRAEKIISKAITDFYDNDNGGFYLYGNENESLIFKPKESYDGAIPSGNSLMTYNLVRLNYLNPNNQYHEIIDKQLDFMAGEAEHYPAGYSMFLSALSDYIEHPATITIVSDEDLSDITTYVPFNTVVKVLTEPTDEYKKLNGQTTFYVCKNHSCLPPMNKQEFYEYNGTE